MFLVEFKLVSGFEKWDGVAISVVLMLWCRGVEIMDDNLLVVSCFVRCVCEFKVSPARFALDMEEFDL